MHHTVTTGALETWLRKARLSFASASSGGYRKHLEWLPYECRFIVTVRTPTTPEEREVYSGNSRDDAVAAYNAA